MEEEDAAVEAVGIVPYADGMDLDFFVEYDLKCSIIPGGFW